MKKKQPKTKSKLNLSISPHEIQKVKEGKYYDTMELLERFRVVFHSAMIPYKDYFENEGLYLGLYGEYPTDFYSTCNNFSEEKSTLFSTYLFHVFRWKFLNLIKKHKREKSNLIFNSFELGEFHRDVHPELFMNDIYLDDFYRQLQQIKNEEDKKIFRMRIVDKNSWREIGKNIGKSKDYCLNKFKKQGKEFLKEIRKSA